MIYFWGYVIIGILSFFRKLLLAPTFRKLLFAPVPDNKLGYIPDKITRGILIIGVAVVLTLVWPIGFLYDMLIGHRPTE